jgi:hypothetical protein
VLRAHRHLIDNAGLFIAKPFTRYSADDDAPEYRR